ncbi:uncharacterized protein JCM15063_005376 [Sporobolomyces koalae]|uniref:uncharacterized protein n=1 Tax=Sporobolomyces koalae TaxID=500713 RepID=UPI00316D75C2
MIEREGNRASSSTRQLSPDSTRVTGSKQTSTRTRYYSWSELTAFETAIRTHTKSNSAPQPRQLVLDRLKSLPLRDPHGSLTVFYLARPNEHSEHSFLVPEQQALKLRNIVIGERPVHGAVARVWRSARQANLASSDSLVSISYSGGPAIAQLALKEQRRRDLADLMPSPKWRPRPSPNPHTLPDVVVSWSQVLTLLKKRAIGSPHWLLRQLVRKGGVVEGVTFINAIATNQDKVNLDPFPIYISWPLLQTILSEAQQSLPHPPNQHISILPLATKKGIKSYTAHGLVEAERLLAFFDHHLEPEQPRRSDLVRAHPSGQVVPKAILEKQQLRCFVPWTEICAAHARYLSNPQSSKDQPTPSHRDALAALRHLFSSSPEGYTIVIEGVASQTAAARPLKSRELYLPQAEVEHILRTQGVLAMPTEDGESKVASSLPSYTLEQIAKAEIVKMHAVKQFEGRAMSAFSEDRWQHVLPWYKPERAKATKRGVSAVARTQGQLLTPAPSAESTPEPVPPPLKRAKSSQLVTTVSNLSIANSAPSTPAPTPPASPKLSATSTTLPEPASVDLAAELIADGKIAASKSFELETLRHVYATAQREGGASFLALDVEFWERDHNILTEFGWSVVEFVKHQNGKVTAKREDQHVVIKENQRFRNGRFAPDARDHFDFGRTLALPSKALYYLLHALIANLSSTHPLFLIFHDPRGDLRALAKLGFDVSKEFQHDLRQFRTADKRKQRSGGESGGVWVVDTQRVFSAWLERKAQVGLEKACLEVNVPTKRLHNAGNDAHYTLNLLEKLLDRSIKRNPESELIRNLDERAAAAKALKLANLASKKERDEQAALKRDL